MIGVMGGRRRRRFEVGVKIMMDEVVGAMSIRY
jgi:hypothetical protein